MRHFTHPLVALFSALVISLLASTASAADLTDQSIRQWAGAFKALQVFCNERDSRDLDFLKQNPTPDMGNLFTDAITRMKSQPIYSDFAGVLKGQGYQDPLVWADQGDRIMAAMMAVQVERSGKNPAAQKAQMQMALQGLQNNPNLTAAQKAQLQQLSGMGNQMLTVAEQAPAADKSAYVRNEALIRALFSDTRAKN